MAKYIGFFLAAVLLVAGAGAVLGHNDLFAGESDFEKGAKFVDDEILVRFKHNDTVEIIKLHERGGQAVANAVEKWSKRDDVLYAEPNYLATAAYIPNDTYYPLQWNLGSTAVGGGIGMEEAWDISKGQGVIVAVVDTGVAYETATVARKKYYRAPDLANTTFVAGYDFVNKDTHPNDDEGHGTHVAGTIAQSTGNGIGVAGIAPEASVMPVKVLNNKGVGTYANIALGIKWAADKGAKVINLSLAGPSDAATLRDAVAYAYGKGAVIVAASGNENTAVSYPAAYDQYVIAVGATRFDETRAPYSNYGAALDIVAPGGDKSVDQNGDGYGDGILQQTFSKSYNAFNYYFMSGTSMATPHVAGVAALVIAHGNAVGPDAVRTALLSTADDLGTAGRDDYTGAGLLNAHKAVLWTPAQ